MEIPKKYNKKYTIKFLIAKMSLETGETVMDITDALLAKLQETEITFLKIDMLRKYIGEEEDKWGLLSEERLEVIKDFFKLKEIEELITEKNMVIRQLSN